MDRHSSLSELGGNLMSRTSTIRGRGRFARALTLIAMALLLAVLAGCSNKSSPSGPVGGADNFGIQVTNGSSLNVTVRIDGPGFSPTSVTVSSSGFAPIEVHAAAGDAITFRADGGGLPTANGGCGAGADALAGYPGLYAQVTILDPLTAGGPLQIICSSGWQ